jgi:membrane-bound lytic murein transglycosylase B
LELERVYRVFMNIFHPNDVYQPLGSRPIYPQRGPDIRELQELLAAQGYYAGEINGRLNASTLEALEAFQSEKGLSERGYVGQRTVAELKKQEGEPER